jgi:hypothetical protein
LNGAVKTAKLVIDAKFPIGSCVYLDLENGPLLRHEQKSYVCAWVDQVEHSGFTAGMYCSHVFAAELHQAVHSARIWAFKVRTTARYPMLGPNYPDNHPGGCGYAGAYVWQLGQNCLISVPGAPKGRLTVDLDSAASANPGAPPAELIAEATTDRSSERATGQRRRSAK